MARRSYGNITKRGDSWRIKWIENGQQRTATVHGSKSDAEMELAKRMLGNGPSDTTMTWGEYWKNAVVPSFDGLARKTVDSYTATWNAYLGPRIGNRRMGYTNWRTVQDVLNGIESPYNQRHAYTLWRKICNMAVLDRLIDANPVGRNIRLHKLPKADRELLSASEVQSWMHGIMGCKYEPILLMELGCGLRPEEANGLRWEAVRFEDGRTIAEVSQTLLVTSEGKTLQQSTKTEYSDRLVVMSGAFAERMMELKKESGPLCPCGSATSNVAESFTSPQAVTRNYKAWCTRREMKYVTQKDLRSNYATLCGEAQVPGYLISMMMGHGDGTTRGRHYQQSTLQALNIAADSYSDYLFGTKWY